jgi:hypothetical protein
MSLREFLIGAAITVVILVPWCAFWWIVGYVGACRDEFRATGRK